MLPTTGPKEITWPTTEANCKTNKTPFPTRSLIEDFSFKTLLIRNLHGDVVGISSHAQPVHFHIGIPKGLFDGPNHPCPN
jgi:hypothetical protein